MDGRMKRSLRTTLWKAGLLLPPLFSGCSSLGTGACCVDNCANVPPGAQPAPNGTYVRRFRDAEAAKAEMDDFVIYKYEWTMVDPESERRNQLGPFGTYHINEIVKRLPFVPFPVMIQAHKIDGDLNEERRQYIVNILRLNGVPDAETRVVVGFPEAEGLYGDEAERIYLQMIAGQDSSGRRGNAIGSPFASPFNQLAPLGTASSLGGFGGGGFNPYAGVGGLSVGRPGGVFGY